MIPEPSPSNIAESSLPKLEQSDKDVAKIEQSSDQSVPNSSPKSNGKKNENEEEEKNNKVHK
jgi:hypothetical protein